MKSPKWTITPVATGRREDKRQFPVRSWSLWTDDRELFRLHLSREHGRYPFCFRRDHQFWSLWTAGPHLVYHPSRFPICALALSWTRHKPWARPRLFGVSPLEVRVTAIPQVTPNAPWKSISTFVDAHWQTFRQLWCWLPVSRKFHFFPGFTPSLVFLFHFILHWHNGPYSFHLFNR